MKEIVKVLKVLSDKNRLRILKLLETKKCCVCELSEIIGITQPSVSRHLKKLKAAGLIQDEQQGFWTDYFLSKPDDIYGKELLAYIRTLLKDDSVVRKDKDKAEKVRRSDLCCKK